ncbi:MAG: cyclic nucleotide-binding domain-containing protein [Spirochaetaceae bacterium]|jgi:CRP-like cAMP-binding protein|nr:cyclic nucleotide-binding domain-containing protein [Spirochaetaceae bacterium]
MENIEFPVVHYKQGFVITQEGEAVPSRFYIVKSGRVTLTTNANKPLRRDGGNLKEGDFFDVAACLAGKKSTTRAVAETDVTLTYIERDKFHDFIGGNLALTNKIVAFLSGRLRFLNECLAHGEDSNVVSESSLTTIYTNAEYYRSKKMFMQSFCAYKKYLLVCPDGQNAELAEQMVNNMQKYGKDIRFDYTEKELRRFYPKGALIFSEAEHGTEMFVIKKGKINITKIVDDNEIVLAVLKQGDILGEMGLIEQKPRSANAIAAEDCEIMAIARAVYLPLLKDGNAILERICMTLASRICNMHERIAKGV